MDATVLTPDRQGTYLSLAVGVVFTLVGVAIVAGGNLAGIAVLVIGGAGLLGGIGGFVPGVGLRLDRNGFYLRSFSKSWGARWIEIEGFTPKRVRVGRREDVDVVEIEYHAGIGDRHVPRHVLGRLVGVDERYLIAAYGNLSNTQLAELLERYRSAAAV